MPADWERRLARWESHGLVAPLTAEHIREFEATRGQEARSRWLAWVAWGLGSLLVGAGILLFVSNAWNDLSPGARLALIASGVAALHVGGGLAERRWPLAASVLHLAATIGLGPAIFTAADVFGMDGDWANAVLMWAAGAAVAWALRRERSYIVLLAVLLPLWLTGEWAAYADRLDVRTVLVVESGIFLSAVAYATAFGEEAVPSALRWTGNALLLPAAAFLALRAGIRAEHALDRLGPAFLQPPSLALLLVAWTVAVAAPIVLAVSTRGKRAWVNALFAAWVLLLVNLPLGSPKLVVYGWLAVGALGFVGWGFVELSVVRLNLGVAAFALLALSFYFDSVMGQLGRSASLVGLGILFIAGGYMLERARRRMVAHVAGGVS